MDDREGFVVDKNDISKYGLCWHYYD